jgi:hypothetical protein
MVPRLASGDQRASDLAGHQPVDEKLERQLMRGTMFSSTNDQNRRWNQIDGHGFVEQRETGFSVECATARFVSFAQN